MVPSPQIPEVRLKFKFSLGCGVAGTPTQGLSLLVVSVHWKEGGNVLGANLDTTQPCD